MRLLDGLYKWSDENRGKTHQRFVIGMLLFGMPILITPIGLSIGLLTGNKFVHPWGVVWTILCTAVALMISFFWFAFFQISFKKFMVDEFHTGREFDAQYQRLR